MPVKFVIGSNTKDPVELDFPRGMTFPEIGHVLSFTMKGNVERPVLAGEDNGLSPIPKIQSNAIFFIALRSRISMLFCCLLMIFNFIHLLIILEILSLEDPR